MTYVTLTPTDLLLAASLLVINAVVSIAFRLQLERKLAIAAVRMVAQLLLAGLVLKFVFQQNAPWATAAAAAVMVAAAGYEALARQHRRLVGWRPHALGLSTLLFVGVAATLFAVATVIRPEPWHAPRYILPIFGMVLGNALTGVALVLDAMTDRAVRERAAIEARLALGHARFDALREPLMAALRSGLMPILNAMAATGIVSLPGMMTGQILAGLDPMEAAKYQVMIMFLIAGSTALAAVLSGLGSVLLLTDERDRLRIDRIVATP